MALIYSALAFILSCYIKSACITVTYRLIGKNCVSSSILLCNRDPLNWQFSKAMDVENWQFSRPISSIHQKGAGALPTRGGEARIAAPTKRSLNPNELGADEMDENECDISKQLYWFTSHLMVREVA